MVDRQFTQPRITDQPSRFQLMAVQTETIQVSGVRCERCVNRLAAALGGHDGLESATANLMGQLTLAWDEERTDRDALLAKLAQAGFREQTPTGAY